MTLPPKVWDDVLRRLRSELPEYSIEAWLLPLVPESGSKAELQLLCPTAFHRDRVRDRFLESIVVCLRQEVGPDATVALALKSEHAEHVYREYDSIDAALKAECRSIRVIPMGRKGTRTRTSWTSSNAPLPTSDPSRPISRLGAGRNASPTRRSASLKRKACS